MRREGSDAYVEENVFSVLEDNAVASNKVTSAPGKKGKKRTSSRNKRDNCAEGSENSRNSDHDDVNTCDSRSVLLKSGEHDRFQKYLTNGNEKSCETEKQDKTEPYSSGFKIPKKNFGEFKSSDKQTPAANKTRVSSFSNVKKKYSSSRQNTNVATSDTSGREVKTFNSGMGINNRPSMGTENFTSGFEIRISSNSSTDRDNHTSVNARNLHIILSELQCGQEDIGTQSFCKIQWQVQIKLPTRQNLLYQLKTTIYYPNPEVFKLTAWLLYTTISKIRDFQFQEKLESFSEHHGDRAHSKTMLVNSKDFIDGVVNGKKIPMQLL
ncbi:unnamed protein product [Mytilus coruscus]|uniref:Uncharacterized protein n=1 Tax=Mytilus coruscus TaxID=42192 RepID=A0A6J8CQT5_MYTCO|nr:unnamed protein product [Mytilus coruscus]